MTGIPGVALSGAKPRLLTIALLVVLGSCWGLYYPIFKFAVRSGLPYSGIMMAITGGVAIALLAVAFARGRPPVFRRHTGRFYLVCAMLGYLVPYAFALFATSRVDAAVLTLIGATSPIITLCLAALTRTERMTGRRLLSIALGAASVAILVIPEASFAGDTVLVGMLAGFGVPLSYSSYHVFVSRHWPVGFEFLPGRLGRSGAGAADHAAGAVLLRRDVRLHRRLDQRPLGDPGGDRIHHPHLLALFRDHPPGRPRLRLPGEFRHRLRRRDLGHDLAGREAEPVALGQPGAADRLAGGARRESAEDGEDLTPQPLFVIPAKALSPVHNSLFARLRDAMAAGVCGSNGILKIRPQRKEFDHPHPGPPPSKRGPIGPQGAGEERSGGD